MAKLMDEHFEKLAREKGRPSSSIVYGKDNPLIALQENTEDLFLLKRESNKERANL